MVPPISNISGAVVLHAIVQLSIYCAPISSILLCCSPIITIQHIICDEKIHHYPLLPYTIMLMNTTLWFVYGLLQNEMSIYITNGISILLAIYYWCIYIRYVHTASSPLALQAILPGTVPQHIIALICTVLIILIYLLVPYATKHSRWLGMLAMLSGILLYASPLTTLQYVIENKCAKSIPLPFTIASFLSCFLWTIYGVYVTNDLNVYLPGMIGCTLSSLQLLLKIYYGEFISEIQDDIDVMIHHDHHQHRHVSETLPLLSTMSESDYKKTKIFISAPHLPQENIVIE